jgi:HSP20 family protein
MAIVRWTRRPSGPFAELDRLQGELNRLFQSFWGPEVAQPRTGVFPPVNISEDSENVYVRAEMPGVKPGDVDIAVAPETLAVSGRRVVEPVEGACYHRREREPGEFQRMIELPIKVNPDAVRATARDGILLVTLPKSEDVKPKKITIEAM